MKKISISALMFAFYHLSAAADFAGCGPADYQFVDGNAQIAISASGYTPKCLKVKAGSQVTIQASARHPLQGVGANNPIFDELGGAVELKTVTMSHPGEYGYFCMSHGNNLGEGMAGSILVE